MLNPGDWLDRVFDFFFKKHPIGYKKMHPIYLKYKELALYGLFGLGTFLIAIFTYALFTETFRWNILFANALSWIFATAFAFYTNRRYVFVSHATGVFAFFMQLWGFSVGRLVTLAIEEGMLYVFIEQMHLPNMTVKCCSQFIVVALNYVFSKLIIFRNQGGIAEDLDC